MIGSVTSQSLRFTLVGLTNTATDVLLYIVLLSITGSIIISNMISTGVALCVSFVLNKRLTFRVTHLSVRQILLFLTVTLFALWVLQPLIILIGRDILLNVLGFAKSNVSALIVKLAAVSVTLFWNYFLYKHVVFKEGKVRP